MEGSGLKGKLKIAEKTIQSLKNTIDKCGQEAWELRSKLLVSEAQLGSNDLRLQWVERKAYKTGFEESKVLAKQILPSVEASLLQILVLAISYAWS